MSIQYSLTEMAHARPLSEPDSASQRALAAATHLIRRQRGEPSADALAMVETLVLS
jgi:hypothetical protein